MKIGEMEVSVIRSATEPVAVSGVIDEHTLRRAVGGVFNRALAAGSFEVVLPAAGCDRGFPEVGCAKILSQEILKVLRQAALAPAPLTLHQITVAVESEDRRVLFERQIFGYLRHVTRDLAWGPYVTTDIIIELAQGVVLIERTNPPFGLALPGGFVDAGESLEQAAVREAREETGLELEDLKQFHTYSDPARDPRFHTITTVFTARGRGNPVAGDDAKGLIVLPHDKLLSIQYAFDHYRVVAEYLDFVKSGMVRGF